MHRRKFANPNHNFDLIFSSGDTARPAKPSEGRSYLFFTHNIHFLLDSCDFWASFARTSIAHHTSACAWLTTWPGGRQGRVTYGTPRAPSATHNTAAFWRPMEKITVIYIVVGKRAKETPQQFSSFTNSKASFQHNIINFHIIIWKYNIYECSVCIL